MYEIYSQFGRLMDYSDNFVVAKEMFERWTQAGFVIYRDGRRSEIVLTKE